MTGFQIGNAIRIAHIVRELTPNTPIVWDGVHPSLLPAQTARHELVDIVVAGEGEQTAVELAAALRGSRPPHDIPGVITPSNSDANPDPLARPFLDLDAVPPPEWSLVDVSDYITGCPAPRSINLSTSRGCPHNCAFCYNQTYNRRLWRARGLLEKLLPRIEDPAIKDEVNEFLKVIKDLK